MLAVQLYPLPFSTRRLRFALIATLLCVVCFGPWFLAAAQEERVVLLHPTLQSSGSVDQSSRLLVFDAEVPGPGVVSQVLDLPLAMGLALDSAGTPYVGSVTFDPLRVEMLRFPPVTSPETYGAVIDSSLRGFIDFIGADFAIRGQSLYLIQGRQRDQDLALTRGARVVRIDLQSQVQEVVWESAGDLSGLTIDEAGRIFVGVMRIEPLTVELVEIRPDRSRRSMGTVFDSSAGFTFARPFQVAAQGGKVYFLHTRVFTSDEQTITEESLRRIDIDTTEVEVLLETDDFFEGLAVDTSGRAFVGQAVFEPFRLELLRRSPDGQVASYGQVIDSTGSTLQFLKIHLATVPAELPGACRSDATTLCFQDGRFEVRGTWVTPAGETGAMRSSDLGRRDSAALYFFAPDNLEVLIKILDACADTGRYWMFYSATTDVGFDLEVRDTVTGIERIYSNLPGSAAEPTFDTNTFLCGDP